MVSSVYPTQYCLVQSSGSQVTNLKNPNRTHLTAPNHWKDWAKLWLYSHLSPWKWNMLSQLVPETNKMFLLSLYVFFEFWTLHFQGLIWHFFSFKDWCDSAFRFLGLKWLFFLLNFWKAPNHPISAKFSDKLWVQHH